jgi:hypothetical protein
MAVVVVVVVVVADAAGGVRDDDVVEALDEFGVEGRRGGGTIDHADQRADCDDDCGVRDEVDEVELVAGDYHKKGGRAATRNYKMTCLSAEIRPELRTGVF